jgi:hypothetical protein
MLLGYGLDNQGSGFNSRQRQEILLCLTTSGPVLGPTQPPLRWEPKNVLQGSKLSGRGPGHTLPSGAEVKNV